MTPITLEPRTTRDDGLDLMVSDVSHQKLARVRGVPRDATVGELIQRSLDRLRLASNDAHGRSLTWQARLDREARRLHASDLVSEVLQPGDRLTLEPNIDAGYVALPDSASGRSGPGAALLVVPFAPRTHSSSGPRASARPDPDSGEVG